MLSSAATILLAAAATHEAALIGGRTLILLSLCAIFAVIGFLNMKVAALSTVTAFVFFAFVRRIFPAMDPNADPAAIGPFIVALPLAFAGLRAKAHASFWIYVAWLIMMIPLGGLSVGIAGAVNVVIPLLAGAAMSQRPDVVPAFVRALLASGLVAFIYGIFQFFHVPAWDARWLQSSVIRFSAGVPGTASFRPFGTLAAPGTGAFLAAALILLAISRLGRGMAGPRLRYATAMTAIIYLALTQVRSAWLALGVAVIVLFARGGKGAARRAMVTVAIGFALVQIPVVQHSLSPRLQTLQSTSQDVSYNSRLELIGQIPGLIRPIGDGLGTSSAGSRAKVDHTLDNGYIVVLAETGLTGFILLAAFLLHLIRSTAPTRYPFVALLLLSNLAGFTFGNLSGLVLFSLIGIPPARQDQVKLDASDVPRQLAGAAQPQ